jgi:hypothetical protein
MSRFSALLICATTLASPVAYAQTTGILVDQSFNIVQQYVQSGAVTYLITGSENAPSAAENISSIANGNLNINNYQLDSTIDNANQYFDFANNATSTGNYSTINTQSIVQVGFQNTSASAVNATLNSVISPAGFGFYMADLSNNTVPDVNKAPESTTATFLDAGSQNIYGYNGLGSVGVTFTVETCADAVVCAQRAATSGIDGLTTIPDSTEEWSALLSLSVSGTPGGPFTAVLAPLDTTFPTPLLDFGLDTTPGSLSEVGYSWDATPISVPIGDVPAGASGYVTYYTTVSTAANYAQTTADNVLLAYAGFGDPIGKSSGGGGISDPEFPILQLDLPTFDPTTQSLTAGVFNSYGPSQLPLTEFSPGVPEPSAWALVVFGVGGIGLSLRRRVRAARA